MLVGRREEELLGLAAADLAEIPAEGRAETGQSKVGTPPPQGLGTPPEPGIWSLTPMTRGWGGMQRGYARTGFTQPRLQQSPGLQHPHPAPAEPGDGSSPPPELAHPPGSHLPSGTEPVNASALVHRGQPAPGAASFPCFHGCLLHFGTISSNS